MTKITKIPFEIKNEISEDVFILYLSGSVAQDSFWSDGGINAELVRSQLDGVTKNIVIRLNSPGGDVWEGMEIYNYLKDHPSHITVEVTGMAASIASVIAMGADKVVMNTGTKLMIHKAWTIAAGNDEDFEQFVQMLRSTNKSIVDVYSERTSQTTDQIETWMKNETWFTSEEAIQYGFADSIKERAKSISNEIDIAALVNKSVAEAMKNISATVSQEDDITEKPKTGLTKLFKGAK